MHIFSVLYRKMCEKAEEIQKDWKPEEWDDYCKKGNYEDGITSQFHAGILSEEIEDFKKNHTWLPRAFQLERRVWKTWGTALIRRLEEKRYVEFIKNEERVEKVKKYFEGDEVLYALALMFVMEDHNKKWDYEKQEWIKIKR